MNAWLNSSCDVIKSMLEEFEKYWDEIHGVMHIVIQLDPGYIMVLVDFFFPQIYGSDSSTNIDIIHIYMLKDLVSANVVSSSSLAINL